MELAQTSSRVARHLLRLGIAAGLLMMASGCAGLSPLDYPPAPIGVPHHHGALPAEPMTLPRFLGLDRAFACTAIVARQQRERIAEFVPALEPQPVASPLSHPDNAAHPSPAVANVHKLKQAKAESAVKVKAVAALAGFDCAADPHVEEGLLAALDDPAAEVREAAIQAVLKSTQQCSNACGGCCSLLIRAKLTHIVFDKKDDCCWVEPSARARRLARLALDACGGPISDLEAGCACEQVPHESPPPHLLQ